MVEECIAKTGKLRAPFFWEGFDDFFGFEYFGFLCSVLLNKPTVHSGGFSTGRVCGCDCWRW